MSRCHRKRRNPSIPPSCGCGWMLVQKTTATTTHYPRQNKKPHLAPQSTTKRHRARARIPVVAATAAVLVKDSWDVIHWIVALIGGLGVF